MKAHLRHKEAVECRSCRSLVVIPAQNGFLEARHVAQKQQGTKVAEKQLNLGAAG